MGRPRPRGRSVASDDGALGNGKDGRLGNGADGGTPDGAADGADVLRAGPPASSIPASSIPGPSVPGRVTSTSGRPSSTSDRSSSTSDRPSSISGWVSAADPATSLGIDVTTSLVTTSLLSLETTRLPPDPDLGAAAAATCAAGRPSGAIDETADGPEPTGGATGNGAGGTGTTSATAVTTGSSGTPCCPEVPGPSADETSTAAAVPSGKRTGQFGSVSAKWGDGGGSLETIR
jgi:hypothetical protein